MPYDPTLPQENTLVDAAQMRAQLQSLKALIDAINAVTAAQVDGVNTLNPADPASVAVSLSANTLHFTFGIPRGQDGAQGAPGEVTTADMNTAISAAIAGTALNPFSISPMNISFSEPPTASQLYEVQSKFNELLAALQRPP